MEYTLQQHLTEYREQIKQHREAIIALNGAVQALERLEKEQTTEEATSGNEQDIDQD